MTEATSRGRVKVVQGHKRVRVYLGSELVADTIAPLLVWEKPYYPTYYLPAGDVRAKLIPTGATEHSPSRGDAEVLDVVAGGATAAGARRRDPDAPVPAPPQAARV